MSEQRPPPSRPSQGPIGWLLSLVGRLIGLVIGTLVLRVVLELAGLYFWWPQEGSRHVFQVMKQEQTELVSALQSHPLGDEILMLLEKGATYVLIVNRLLHKPFIALAYTLVSFMQRLKSVFLHRYVIRSGSSVTTTLWVFYLAQPLFLPTILVLLPTALWSGITVWMAAASFKRWL